jgi:hypothetical protein
MLELKRISNFKNKLVPSKSNYSYPQYNLTGESAFWFSIISGSRGSGKTNAMLRIVDIEHNVMVHGANMLYWVSPTCDSKVQALIEKYPDNVQYVDELTRKSLGAILDEIADRIAKWKEQKYVFDLFEHYLKDENSVSEEELNILEETGLLESETDVKALIKSFNFAHPPISTLVIDDSLGANLISGANSVEGKWFIKFAIKHRHEPHLCNLFILTQHFKAISKPLRVNANNIVLFPSKDRGVSDSIFEEFSPLFKGKIENYHEALQYMEDTPHSFMFLWYDRLKFARIGFDQQIVFKEGGHASPLKPP